NPKFMPQQFISALPRHGMGPKLRGPIRSALHPKSAANFNVASTRGIDPDQQIARAALACAGNIVRRPAMAPTATAACTRPMHSDVLEAAPGKCPRCGMTHRQGLRLHRQRSLSRRRDPPAGRAAATEPGAGPRVPLFIYWSMMPRKPAPHLMRGGYRFSENIMLQQ